MTCPKTFKDVFTFTMVVSRDGYSLTMPFLHFCSYSRLDYVAKLLKKAVVKTPVGKFHF